LNDGAQQQRPFPLEAEIVPRQKPRIVEVKSFWSRADDSDIAILVENREGIAMFQTAKPPLNKRSLDFDIVLGQLNLHVHGAFRSSREPNLSVKKSLSHRLLTVSGWFMIP